MALEITDENFDTLVINKSKPAVLDFWAPRCGPCKVLSQHIEALALEYQDQVIVGKVNVDTSPELLLKFGIRSIPTIAFLKDGKVVKKQVGATSKKILEEKLRHYLLNVNV